MSLKSLPTELDIKIIEALCPTNARKALSALSRTSKYYRKLVEPMLYRDLTLRAVDNIHIKRLFLTLLVREDSPQHIRSFTLSDSPLVNPDGGWDVLGPGDLADDLLKHDNLIKSAVLKLPLPSYSALELFGGIFSHSGTSLSSQPRYATLTMILSMSTNIERIDLASLAPHFLDYTREVLGCSWIDEGDVGLLSFQFRGEIRKMRTQTFFFTPNF
jgi:hypothetical protein